MAALVIGCRTQFAVGRPGRLACVARQTADVVLPEGPLDFCQERIGLAGITEAGPGNMVRPLLMNELQRGAVTELALRDIDGSAELERRADAAGNTMQGSMTGATIRYPVGHTMIRPHGVQSSLPGTLFLLKRSPGCLILM